MGLMTRMTTLLKADAHGVVDALEDRALTLRQHVREAEAEVVAKRARLEALDVEQQDLAGEADAIGKEKKDLDDDVELALSDGKEELARFAIRKLLPLRRRTASIERRLEALVRERSELGEELGRQEGELDELKSRTRAYLARLGRPEGSWKDSPDASWWEPVADEEVELELLRRRKETGKKAKGGA